MLLDGTYQYKVNLGMQNRNYSKKKIHAMGLDLLLIKCNHKIHVVKLYGTYKDS